MPITILCTGIARQGLFSEAGSTGQSDAQLMRLPNPVKCAEQYYLEKRLGLPEQLRKKKRV
jgi:hypothetical protein